MQVICLIFIKKGRRQTGRKSFKVMPNSRHKLGWVTSTLIYDERGLQLEEVSIPLIASSPASCPLPPALCPLPSSFCVLLEYCHLGWRTKFYIFFPYGLKFHTITKALCDFLRPSLKLCSCPFKTVIFMSQFPSR